MLPYIIVAIILLTIIVVILLSSSKGKKPTFRIFEAPQRRAGRIGEQIATRAISSVLRENDCLLNNVQINCEGRPAELDNVIINRYGVFIIEVKNYSGTLVGCEDDFEWTKYHTTDAGNTYSKTVKNPIKQVRRQIDVLARYIKRYSSENVWIEGYALLIEGNSPVKSKFILSGTRDIDRAIHTKGKNRLSQKDIEKLKKLLS